MGEQSYIHNIHILQCLVAISVPHESLHREVETSPPQGGHN